MFRWLINWFLRRRARKARELFAFFDGHRIRRMDPFALEAGFATHPEFNYDLLELVQVNDRESTETTLRAICDVFGVTPWNPVTERGLTQPELLQLFMQFDTYCETLKKKYNLGPISPEPMAPQFCSTPPDCEATSLPSDCTSTSVAPNCDAAAV